MREYLTYTQSKFTFKVATDRLYHPAGVRCSTAGKADGWRVTVGVSDFCQHHRHVVITELPPVGTAVTTGGVAPLITLETIKANVDLPCPSSSSILQVNDKLKTEPEVINLSPYIEIVP